MREEPWPRLLLIAKIEAFFIEVKRKLEDKQYAYSEKTTSGMSFVWTSWNNVVDKDEKSVGTAKCKPLCKSLFRENAILELKCIYFLYL